jgi:ABC-type transport system involved in multi-copper enzyme maturation permease subunit
VNLQPVVRRELRVASRRRETWRLRVYFGAGAAVSAVFGMLLPDITRSERGLTVLISMAVCGLVLSVFSGPYLTADAVSSEKREGTLGLLFLTPLNGWEIVSGKMLTHSLQVSYALVGGFPLFFLPVLLGGVVWSEVTRLVLVLLLTLLVSLACGVFWSTVSREARTAVLATTVTMILLTLLPWLWVLIQDKLLGGTQLVGPPLASPMTGTILAFESNYRRPGYQGWGVASGAFVYWGSVCCMLGLSAVLLAISGWLLRGVWRRAEAGTGAPKPPRREVGFMINRLRWTPALERAPLVWLAARGLAEGPWLPWVRWTGVVFFGIMLVVSVSTSFWEGGYTMAFCSAYGLHLWTRIQLALAATRRLNEDWRSGALELVLTTPVQEIEMVRAHHESLKRAFLRPLLLLLGLNGLLESAVILFPRELHMDGGAGLVFTSLFLAGAVVTPADLVTLRWLGLRESLRQPTQLKATGRTFGLLVAGPWLGFGVAFLLAVGLQKEVLAAFIFSCWGAACLLYDWLLIRSCRHWLRRGLRRRASEGEILGLSLQHQKT